MLYTRDKLLGAGAYGSVYNGLLTGSSSPVAIKEFAPYSADIPSRILREINAIAPVSHPNIACLIGVSAAFSERRVSVVLEYGGATMNRFISNNSPSARREFFRPVFSGVLSALAYLHAVNIMHRDIKPDNILIKQIGSDVTSKLCDFSLSKKIQPYRSQRHSYSVSTVNYKAPELFSQVHRDYNYAPDVWSLGCTAWEFVTNKFLFQGSTDLAVITEILRVVPVTASSLRSVGAEFISLPECNTSASHRFPQRGCSMPTFAARLITKSLTLCPRDRPSAASLLKSCDERAAVAAYSNSKRSHADRRYSEYFYVRKKQISEQRLETRAMIIEEIEAAVEFGECNIQTLAVAIELADRFVCETSDADAAAAEFDVIARVCLYAASKLVDFRPMLISEACLLATESAVVEWERAVLSVAGIDSLHAPTILDIYKASTRNKSISRSQFYKLIEMMKQYSEIAGKSAKEIGECLRAKEILTR
jgi:serine/threonine protein kinase